MRIVYADAEAYPSAAPASLQALHTCIGLADHGDTVWLVGGRGGGTGLTAYYGVLPPPNLQICTVPRFRWHAGGIRAAWNLPMHLEILYRLRWIVRTAEVSAIIVRNLKLADFLLRAHRRSPLPPILFEAHQIYGDVAAEAAVRTGEDVSRHRARLTALESAVYAEAAGLIVLTRAMADLIQSRFQTRGVVAVVPDAVDPAQALPPVDAAESGPVTYLGNLHYWKGVEAPLRAVGLAPRLRMPVIEGAPDPRAHLAAWRKRWESRGASSSPVPCRPRRAGSTWRRRRRACCR